MVFDKINDNQRAIAASSILLLGIVQISLDSWTLSKINQHEELTIFLSGNSIPKSVLQEMTYEQALSYFLRLRGYMHEDVLDILGTLKMSAILGLVAGIIQIFSSAFVVMLKGLHADIFWLVVNVITAVLLSVSVAHIAVTMIRDVLYHQVTLTVTTVNLFILVHVWVINLIAVVYSTCLKENDESSEEVVTEHIQTHRSSSLENMPPSSRTPSRIPSTSDTQIRDTPADVRPAPRR